MTARGSRLAMGFALACVVWIGQLSGGAHGRLRTATLKNGLRVVIDDDPMAPLVAVAVGYKVGSRDDPIGKTGLAHALEHLMFRGSAHVAAGRHFGLINESGGTAGAFTL